MESFAQFEQLGAAPKFRNALKLSQISAGAETHASYPSSAASEQVVAKSHARFVTGHLRADLLDAENADTAAEGG